jgi:hypothetical protein
MFPHATTKRLTIDDLSVDERMKFEDYMEKLDEETGEEVVLLVLHDRSSLEGHLGEGSKARFLMTSLQQPPLLVTLMIPNPLGII